MSIVNVCILFLILIEFFIIKSYKKKRKNMIVLMGINILFVIGFMVFYVSWNIPVKGTIKEEEFENYNEFILIREVHYTGTGWNMIGNENGFFSKEDIKDIELKGRLPKAKMPENYNVFLCIVEYEGLIEHVAFEEKIECYKIREWLPVYPIVRNRILPQFFYPRNYMTKYDIPYY